MAVDDDKELETVEILVAAGSSAMVVVQPAAPYVVEALEIEHELGEHFVVHSWRRGLGELLGTGDGVPASMFAPGALGPMAFVCKPMEIMTLLVSNQSSEARKFKARYRGHYYRRRQ